MITEAMIFTVFFLFSFIYLISYFKNYKMITKKTSEYNRGMNAQRLDSSINGRTHVDRKHIAFLTRAKARRRANCCNRHTHTDVMDEPCV